MLLTERIESAVLFLIDRLDLTKRNLDILNTSREAVKVDQNVAFVFADINCNLAVKKSNVNFLIFDSLEDLTDKLSR